MIQGWKDVDPDSELDLQVQIFEQDVAVDEDEVKLMAQKSFERTNYK